MSDLLDFGEMINDSVRMRAYYEALRRSVHPDSVVLDIGTGTGIFALLACQLGARRVYAVDPNPWIELGPKMAAANGFADRIVFIRDLSTQITLPEQADILISELRGRQPLVAFNLPVISDARQRLLKPGGVVIPQRDVVKVSLISAPGIYQKNVVEPWLENEFHLNMSAAVNFARNTPRILKRREFAEVSQPLFSPQVWADFDYRTREDANAQAHIEWVADSACTAHYLMLWFDTYLFEDVGFTSAPWAQEHASLYAYDVFVLQEPLEIAPHDKITLDLGANLIQGDYVFTWNTSVREDEGAGRSKAAFRQSTFFGTVLSDMRKHQPNNPRSTAT